MPDEGTTVLILEGETCHDSPTLDGEETPMAAVNDYKYRGAGALVKLHQQHLVSFFVVWQQAHARGVAMPPTEDPDCASLEAVLAHVLRAARGYMVWMCQVLELPDPQIDAAPGRDEAKDQAAAYLEHLIVGWDGPLLGVDEKAFFTPTHRAPWGVATAVDAMLEHAVMHPIRHQYQLEGLLADETSSA